MQNASFTEFSVRTRGIRGPGAAMSGALPAGATGRLLPDRDRRLLPDRITTPRVLNGPPCCFVFPDGRDIPLPQDLIEPASAGLGPLPRTSAIRHRTVSVGVVTVFGTLADEVNNGAAHQNGCNPCATLERGVYPHDVDTRGRSSALVVEDAARSMTGNQSGAALRQQVNESSWTQNCRTAATGQ